jgi:hypothetical protein
MSEGNGCFEFLGVAGFVIGVFLLINNVQPVVIEQKVPPPQESWSYVYPKFKDDVSLQLLNTQELVGVAIRDAEYIKAQNVDLQYSIDILLNELGIVQKKYEEESKKQRTEQWLLMGVGAIVGWIISIILPKERIENIANKIFHRNIGDIASGNNEVGDNTKKATTRHISIRELHQTDPVARSLATIILVLASVLALLIFMYFWVI